MEEFWDPESKDAQWGPSVTRCHRCGHDMERAEDENEHLVFRCLPCGIMPGFFF